MRSTMVSLIFRIEDKQQNNSINDLIIDRNANGIKMVAIGHFSIHELHTMRLPCTEFSAYFTSKKFSLYLNLMIPLQKILLWPVGKCKYTLVL